jgi:hypothetical protein
MIHMIQELFGQTVRRVACSLRERFYPSDESWLRNVGGKTIDDAKAL